jgi:AbrB family looped-hinge helix DNA binding protein
MQRWVWEKGVGIIVEVDDRGRITIPVDIRRKLKSKKLLVSLKGDAIELRPVHDERLEALKRFNEIKLIGDPRFVNLDASKAKHKVGGKKH